MHPDDDHPPRPSELDPLAADVVYEYGMFLWAAEQLLSGVSGRLRDACVEVLLLHQRNLVEFFRPGRRQDDVIAQDYAPGWAPSGTSWEWLVARQRPAHKRLAHIAAYRQRVPKRIDAKDVRESRLHVSKVWTQFASHAAPRWGSRFVVGE